MKKTRFVPGWLLLICLIVISGCSSNSPDPSTPPEPTPTATSHPAPTDPPNLLDTANTHPVGFALQISCQKIAPCLQGDQSVTDGAQLILFSAAGEEIQRITIPGYGDVLHIASRMDIDNPGQIAIVFRNLETNEIQLISDGEIIESFDGANLYRLRGAESQQVYALSYLPGTNIQGETDSGLSEIFVAPEMKTMVVSQAPDSLVIPVAIRGNRELPPNNRTIDLWYTLEPYGIGGGIIFPQYRGLFYILGDGTEIELISKEFQFSSLSHDGSYTAYTLVPRGEMMVKDLRTFSDKSFPLLPTSGQGAGLAVFSPDSKQLAWMEASGDLYADDLETVIRIAAVNGDILTNLPTSIFKEITGLENLIVYPVGWLDSERVLLQISEPGKHGIYQLVIARTNGSIDDHVIEGKFIEILYGD